MIDPSKKLRHLASWYERLSNTFLIVSLDAWHRELRQELHQLIAQGLIDADEAKEMRELADAAYRAERQSSVASK
ncbi:hypothetical protein ACYZTX_29355 [Pseudomonas sp. MDT1-17]